eukprot:scaffold966_cov415-Prasinococcus_capsulatus_cf.AAC.32
MEPVTASLAIRAPVRGGASSQGRVPPGRARRGVAGGRSSAPRRSSGGLGRAMEPNSGILPSAARHAFHELQAAVGGSRAGEGDDCVAGARACPRKPIAGCAALQARNAEKVGEPVARVPPAVGHLVV